MYDDRTLILSKPAGVKEASGQRSRIRLGFQGWFSARAWLRKSDGGSLSFGVGRWAAGATAKRTRVACTPQLLR